MLFKTVKKRGSRIYTPPLIILGAVFILLVILLVLAMRNINREKKYMSQILSEKGVTIIRSYESGTRTGMMRMMWGREQNQTLLEEIARQPGILYIVITDRDGHILADNNRGEIGKRFIDPGTMQKLRPDTNEQWRVADTGNGKKAFEVYRYYRPLGKCAWNTCMKAPQKSSMPWQGRWNPARGGVSAGEIQKEVIFVGLDTTPFESGRREDIKNTLIISAVLLLLGFGGFLSLFWAQHYRLANRMLQDTTAFAKKVVTHLPAGLIATGSDGSIEFVNGEAERITGYSLKKVREQKPDRVFPSLWTQIRDDLEKRETVLEREIECTFSGLQTVPLVVSAARIVNEEGDLVGDIVMFRDLGEVRKLKEKIRRSEKLAALGKLAAGVAHEIRNPLSSIKGFATYFGTKFNDGSEDKKAAEVMIQEVDRLNRVISELLEFARPSELKPREANINEVIEHSLRLIREDAKTKEIAVRFRKDPKVPRVFIDSDRFFQALLNLYLNSIESMDKGGILEITVFSLNHREIQIDIKDTGKGISSENTSRVFDPYFTTKASGTGLGLAIVHKIIEAHGGEIKVKSREGEGTAFALIIPANQGLTGAKVYGERE